MRLWVLGPESERGKEPEPGPGPGPGLDEAGGTIERGTKVQASRSSSDQQENRAHRSSRAKIL